MSRTLVVVLLTATLAAGCAPPRPAAVPTPPYAFAIIGKTTSLYPVQMNQTQFQAQVTDKNGRPVSGAAVSISLAMPGMDMGKNMVMLSETKTPGVYTGTGRFGMPGGWQMTVTADKGAAHQSQTFPVSVH